MAEEYPEQNTIIVEDETLRPGFTMFQNALFSIHVPQKNGPPKRLSPGAKVAYIALLSYSWKKGSCFPGQQRLADDVGCGLRSVHTYTDELVTAGIITVKQRGLNKTNLYIIHKLPEVVLDDEA